MMTGAHVMLFSKDADADRAFVRDMSESEGDAIVEAIVL